VALYTAGINRWGKKSLHLLYSQRRLDVFLNSVNRNITSNIFTSARLMIEAKDTEAETDLNFCRFVYLFDTLPFEGARFATKDVRESGRQ